MQIAVVEDKTEDRELLCAMLEQYCASRGVSAEISCFPSGDAVLREFLPGRFQCVFLDIYMEGTDGMETARQIYRQDPSCRLVFTTVSLSHAVASYEVRAAWYLTKPLSARLLADAMDAACADALQNSRSLSVHVQGTEVQLLLGDIFFMDCLNRQARLHLAQRVLEVDEPVGELMGQLASDNRFLPCNRNTMVNMDHVERVEEQDFYLKNGAAVSLRQRGRASLKKAFLAWSLRELRGKEAL